MRMSSFLPLVALIGIAWMLPSPMAWSQETTAAAPAASELSFDKSRMEELVAPIALHPDALVAQILPASTYPLEVVQAARWAEKNNTLKGAQLEQALAAEPWDSSVKAVATFPNLIRRMSDDLSWTQDLGDAFLAHPKVVMDTIQLMRQRAYKAGTLKTTPQQKVTVEGNTIIIEASGETVYAPDYDPGEVYGAEWTPPPEPYYPMYTYPPDYWYPPAYYPPGSGLIGFGVGIIIAGAIWGDNNWGCDWGNGNVHVDHHASRNTDANRNVDRGGGNWQHNPEHRGETPYRDQGSQQKFDKGRTEAVRNQTAGNRDSARGFDRGSGGERQPGGDMQRPSQGGMGDMGGRDQGSLGIRDGMGNDFSSRDGQMGVVRGSHTDNSAFSGVGSSSDRGASNRGGSSRSYSGGSSRGYYGSRGGGGMRGGGMRGGGGRRR